MLICEDKYVKKILLKCNEDAYLPTLYLSRVACDKCSVCQKLGSSSSKTLPEQHFSYSCQQYCSAFRYTYYELIQAQKYCLILSIIRKIAALAKTNQSYTN